MTSRIYQCLGLLLLSIPASAAFSYTATSSAFGVTHAGAKMIMSTSVNTTATIVWDTVSHSSSGCANVGHGGYSYSDADGGNFQVHSWFVGGLTASTKIYWQWCANDGTGVVGSGEQTFTTLALPNPHPQPATLPTSTVNTVYTAPTGTVRTLGVTSGCSTLVSCWAISTCGDTIQIQAGTTDDESTDDVGTGSTMLTPVSCASNPMVIRTSAPDSALPPPGVRIDPSYRASMASIENPLMAHGQAGTTRTNNNCYAGYYFWDFVSNAAGWHMFKCVPNTPVSLVSVTGAQSAIDQYYTGTYTTAAPHGFSVGDQCFVSGVTGSLGQYRPNGSCVVLTTPSSTTFTAQTQGTYFVGSPTDYPETVAGTGGTVSNNSWQNAPYTPVSLSSLPSACAVGDWGYDSTGVTQNYDTTHGPVAGASTGQVVRCTSPNTWSSWKIVLQTPMHGSFIYYALDLSGSVGVRLIGLRLSRVRPPADPLWLRSGNSPDCTNIVACPGQQGGKIGYPALQTSVSSSNIIIDRCFIDEYDYPYGDTQNAMVLNGSNIALVESYMSGVGLWFGAADRGSFYQDYATASILRSGGATMLYRNNYLEGYGITIHNDDSLTGFFPLTDVSTVNNTFYRNPTHFYGSSQAAATYPEGVYWSLRQLYEHKSGQRVLIGGNVFNGNWRNVSGGEAIALDQRMDSSNALATSAGGTVTFTVDNGVANTNINTANLAVGGWLDFYPPFDNQIYGSGVGVLRQIVSIPSSSAVTVSGLPDGSYWVANASWLSGILDVTISNNTVMNVPNFMNTYGVLNADNEGFGAAPMIQALPVERTTITNNIFNSILDDGSLQDPQIWQSAGGGTIMRNISRFFLDPIFTHNTAYKIGGLATSIWNTSQGSGYLPSSEGAQVTNNLGLMVGSTMWSPINSNSNSLSGTAVFATYFSNYVEGNNVWFCCAGVAQSGYPPSDTFATSLSSFGWYDVGLNNFRLKSNSPFVSGGAKHASDGFDMGASIDDLEAGQGKVSNVRALNVTTNSATVSFLAPDSSGCSVDWSTDGFATWTRVANTGGGRVQNVALTSLPGASNIRYRVNCKVMQPLGSLNTP